MMSDGRWRQPPDELISSVIPFLKEPVDFLMREDQMRFESSGLLADIADASIFNREYRSSTSKESPDLPWIDVDRSFFIAVNRRLGDDVGIALDLRTSETTPALLRAIGIRAKEASYGSLLLQRSLTLCGW